MPNTVFLLKLSAFSLELSDLPIRYMQRSECFTGNNCLKQGIGRKECRKGMFHGKHMFRREHFRFCTAALFDCKKTPHKATFTESGIKTEII